MGITNVSLKPFAFKILQYKKSHITLMRFNGAENLSSQGFWTIPKYKIYKIKNLLKIVYLEVLISSLDSSLMSAFKVLIIYL